MFAVCNTSTEQINDWKQELNNMCLRKYGQETTLLIILITPTGPDIAEHLINNRVCASFYSADLFTILSMSHSDFYLIVLEIMNILTH